MTSARVDTRFSEIESFQKDSRYLEAKSLYLMALAVRSESMRGIRPPRSADASALLKRTIVEFQQDRGRELYFPYIATGIGSGPFVELLDGSVKYDMITGIGINFFGHAHPDFVDVMFEGLCADVMQGNLQPSVEACDVLRALLSRVGAKSRLKHAWLTCSGTMANENALKIIRQKKAPATRMFAFKDCFAGRSTAMQEITDNPKYREGQPLYGEVTHLPFYDPARGIAESIEQAVGEMRKCMQDSPGKYAGLTIELVQGEGGFRYGPREYYVGLFEACRELGLAVWVDEIQTFGRTGELFAYQTFGLEEYVDVVTIGKLFQACALIYTPEYNPRPGLVAGTFTGNSNTLRAARRALEILDRDRLLGREGKIAKLSKRFESSLKELQSGSCKGLIGELRIIGGMVGFIPFAGTMDDVKKLIFEMFDRGVVAYYCGHDPYLIRMLPPLAVMEERDVDAVCEVIEASLIALKGKTGIS